MEVRAVSARTDVTDVFAHGWTRDLLELRLRTTSSTFAGRLSTLWVDDELAAAHLGIASDRVSHYWFPAYNQSFSNHSPGLLLLLEMAEDAGRSGYERFDLGWGDARHKREFANTSVPVLAGSVGSDAVSRCRQRLDDLSAHAMAGLRQTPLAGPLRVPSRLARAYGDRRRLA